jgi:hypothetical protein
MGLHAAPPVADPEERLEIFVTKTEVDIIKGNPHECIRIGTG